MLALGGVIVVGRGEVLVQSLFVFEILVAQNGCEIELVGMVSERHSGISQRTFVIAVGVIVYRHYMAVYIRGVRVTALIAVLIIAQHAYIPSVVRLETQLERSRRIVVHIDPFAVVAVDEIAAFVSVSGRDAVTYLVGE